MRLTQKEMKWLMSNELPLWALYDYETEEIQIVIDNFFKGLWKLWKKTNFVRFIRILMEHSTHTVLHEYIHEIIQPDEFPVLQEIIVTQGFDACCRVLEIWAKEAARCLVGWSFNKKLVPVIYMKEE